jgi:hypothetical protein
VKLAVITSCLQSPGWRRAESSGESGRGARDMVRTKRLGQSLQLPQESGTPLMGMEAKLRESD